jgi:hypothetical protein
MTEQTPERDAAWKHRELTYGTCAVCGEARDLRHFTDEAGNSRVEIYQPCGHPDGDAAADQA